MKTESDSINNANILSELASFDSTSSNSRNIEIKFVSYIVGQTLGTLKVFV